MVFKKVSRDEFLALVDGYVFVPGHKKLFDGGIQYGTFEREGDDVYWVLQGKDDRRWAYRCRKGYMQKDDVIYPALEFTRRPIP